MNQNFNFFYPFYPNFNPTTTLPFLSHNPLPPPPNPTTFFHSLNYPPSTPNLLSFYPNSSQILKN